MVQEVSTLSALSTIPYIKYAIYSLELDAVARRQTGSMIGQGVGVLLQSRPIHAGPPWKTDLPIERGVGNGRKGGMGKRLMGLREEKILIIYSSYDPPNWIVRVRHSERAALSSNIVSAVSSSLLFSSTFTSYNHTM